MTSDRQPATLALAIFAETPITDLDRFLQHLAGSGAAPASCRAARADLRGLVRWWEVTHPQPFALSLLVERDLRAWQSHRQRVDGAAPSTINRALSTLRSCCAWAVEQGLLQDNPASALEEVPTAALSPRGLPNDVVDALLREASQEPNPFVRSRDLAALALLVYAGLRVQEVCDVQLRDLDLPAASVTVRSGKGGKPRRLPLHPDAVRLLQTYLAKDRCPAGLPQIGVGEEREPLLAGQDITAPGQPIRPGVTPSLLRLRLKLLGQAAAARMLAAADKEADLRRQAQLEQYAVLLTHVSPHQLRHTMARRLLSCGAQLPEVQRMLGHSRLSTTGVYLTPSEDDLRQAVDRAGV